MQDVTYATNSAAVGMRNFGDQVAYYAQVWGPRILAALLILLIGYILARAAKWAIASLVNRTPLARRANDPKLPPRSPKSIGAQVGEAAFWVVLLVALFLAAQPLGLTAATGPLGQMLNQFGAAVPRIIGAGLIFFIGYILASVAKKAVEAVVTASHVEKLSDKVGTRTPADPTMLPRTLGSIVFALILIPVAIAALDTLNIAAISRPATAMLALILDAIPRVIAAGIILALAYVIGRFASQLLTQFLSTTGFDRTVSSLGLFGVPAARTVASRVTVDGEPLPVTTSADGMTPSKAVGTAVFVAIIIFGLMEAFRQLDFAYGSRIMAEILALLGSVVFGAVIIAAAVAIARLVARAIEASGGEGARLAASLTRVAIIILGAAIGLRFMGLADDIIQLAFGLILGAIAVAAAIAFGLGGREPAGQLLQRLFARVETKIDAAPGTAAQPMQRTRTPPPPRA